MSENLVSNLKKEIKRNKELLVYYGEIRDDIEEIGIVMMVKTIIKQGEDAIENMDAVGMLEAYNELKEKCNKEVRRL